MKAIVSLTKYGLIHFWKIEIAGENIFISFYLNDDTYISYNAYNLQLINKQILMNFYTPSFALKFGPFILINMLIYCNAYLFWESFVYIFVQW